MFLNCMKDELLEKGHHQVSQSSTKSNPSLWCTDLKRHWALKSFLSRLSGNIDSNAVQNGDEHGDAVGHEDDTSTKLTTCMYSCGAPVCAMSSVFDHILGPTYSAISGSSESDRLQLWDRDVSLHNSSESNTIEQQFQNNLSQTLFFQILAKNPVDNKLAAKGDLKRGHCGVAIHRCTGISAGEVFVDSKPIEMPGLLHNEINIPAMPLIMDLHMLSFAALTKARMWQIKDHFKYSWDTFALSRIQTVSMSVDHGLIDSLLRELCQAKGNSKKASIVVGADGFSENTLQMWAELGLLEKCASSAGLEEVIQFL